jgi:hypothetical protein
VEIFLTSFVEFRAVSFGLSGSFRQFSLISAGERLAQKPCRAKLAEDAKKIKKSGSLWKEQGVAETVMKKFVIILNSSIPRANPESTVMKMDVVDNNG